MSAAVLTLGVNDDVYHDNSVSQAAATPQHQQMNLDEIFFTLSVNFLLYAVLIIVFYMVVKYYIDDSSFLFNQPNDEGIHPLEDGYKGGYFAVQTDEDSAEMTSGSNVIEAEEDEDQSSNSNSKIGSNNCNNNSNDNNNSSSSSSGAIEKSIEMKTMKSSISNSGGESSPRSPRLNKNMIFLNLSEASEKGSKEEELMKLGFCAAGLWISFVIWGIAQERLLTQPYGNQFFEYSYGLVFITRLGGFFLSVGLMYYYKVDWVSSPLWEYSFPSVANIISSWCQYEALKYVSFPSVMLAKAFKMVPIMLMGWFMHNKSYKSYEYLSAGAVGFGLYLFLSSSETIDFKENSIGDPGNISGAMCGVVLLILFLFFDSITSNFQTRMFKMHENKNEDLSPVQMMLVMNAFSSVFSFVTLVNQDELGKSLAFVSEHKDMWLHLIIFTIAATCGQIFIYYTVKHFGPVVFSIIMSFRILLSTILSCWIYSHPITELGVLGMMLVFGATAYRYHEKSKGKQLISYHESPEEAKQVLHEWHEHLDC